MEQFDFITDDAVPESAEESRQEPESSDNGMPLAARMRPTSLSEYAGQRHILGPGKLLRRAIETDHFSSLIFSGPPGVGKTSLAELIARETDAEFIRLSGVTSTVADIRKAIANAVIRQKISNRKTILFIDEIHRFNKAQQDSLLPDVEHGRIRLIGATTHNPQFYVVGALLSRSMVFQLEPISEEDIRILLERAWHDPRGYGKRKLEITPEALAFLAQACEGDARRSLNALELAVSSTHPGADGVIRLTETDMAESIQRKIISYGDDGHYDTASAFIKSMRGSDPDAAIYYLAKMLAAGEDIRFIARRLIIFASEDIGNADPRALPLAVAAWQGLEMVGLPEARILLAQAVTFCATAPKSNASYEAIGAALSDVEHDRVQPIPPALRDPNSAGGKANHHGEGYLYPHEHGGYVRQDYLAVPKVYYRPRESGYEIKIRERMEYYRACAAAKASGGSDD